MFQVRKLPIFEVRHYASILEDQPRSALRSAFCGSPFSALHFSYTIVVIAVRYLSLQVILARNSNFARLMCAGFLPSRSLAVMQLCGFVALGYTPHCQWLCISETPFIRV